jgi:hypothetical protein
MAGAPILLVDDSPVNLKLLRLLLSYEGFGARTSERAEDALQMLDTFRPPLVLTDIRMPGMDGVRVDSEDQKQPADQRHQSRGTDRGWGWLDGNHLELHRGVGLAHVTGAVDCARAGPATGFAAGAGVSTGAKRMRAPLELEKAPLWTGRGSKVR